MDECWNIYWHILFRFNMTNCWMPKLVGTQLTVHTLTQITLVMLPYSHMQVNDCFLQKIVSLIFFSWPPTLSVNIIDFYVERVTKSEKLTSFFMVNRWLWISGWNYVHQVARVSSETLSGHFDPRRSGKGLLVVTFLTMKIKRYLLLISYWYWM